MTQDGEPTWLGATISRRTLLSASAVLGGLIACSPTGERTVPPESSTLAPQREPTPPADLGVEEYEFFTEEEARTIEAMVARIIPGDDADPGAIQAGVPVYIDRKLSRFKTFAEPTYHQGPFAEEYEGEEAPDTSPDTVAVPASELDRYGFQSALTPQEHYRLGLAAMDRYAQTRYGSLFADLEENQQDELLMVLDDAQDGAGSDTGGGDSGDTVTDEEGGSSGEDGGTGGGDDAGGNGNGNGFRASDAEIEQAAAMFGELDPGEFFSTVRMDTIEGMFSDPEYGGNRNLVGWTLVGWPGAQRSYSPHEMLHGTSKTPQSMNGLTPMNPDRAGPGREALEQPREGVHNH